MKVTQGERAERNKARSIHHVKGEHRHRVVLTSVIGARALGTIVSLLWARTKVYTSFHSSLMGGRAPKSR